MENEELYERREEIPYIDQNTSIKKSMRDETVSRRLKTDLAGREKETGKKHVLGEWYVHRGFEIVVAGHGFYDIGTAGKIMKKCSRGNPFFGVCLIS